MFERCSDRREELALLEAVLSGDCRACASFVRRYNPTIELCVRQVYRRAGAAAAPDDVEDMVHEIWLGLFEHDKRCLRRFDPERLVRVSTWIGLLARNKTVDKLRCAGARERLVRLGDEGTTPERPSEVPLPPEQVERREREQIAQWAFEGLRLEERRFLEAWYVEEREPEQLAAELGIAVATVYTRRFKLQEKLAKNVLHLSRRGLASKGWRRGSRPIERRAAARTVTRPCAA